MLLALALWIALGSLAPGPAPPPADVLDRPDDPAAADCAEARRIAAMEPCLDPESCRAAQAWSELLAPPSTRPLEPAVRVRAPKPCLLGHG